MSDRRTLIRLASTLPKGSAQRRAILGGLSKQAAGPNPRGSNWKQRKTSGVIHWIWNGGPEDDIERMIVETGDRVDGQRNYYLTVRMKDGQFFKSPASPGDRMALFAMGADIYKDKTLNPGSMRGWRRLATTRVRMRLAEDWMEDAVKRPGRLHKFFGIPEDENIPMSKIDGEIAKLKKKDDRTKEEDSLLAALNLAKTFKKTKKAATADGLTPESLVEYLRDSGDTVSVRTLNYAFPDAGGSNAISAMIKKMVKDGQLVKEKGGYALPKSASIKRRASVPDGGWSPEIKKLNKRFADGFAKELASILKWTYLNDDTDGIALWISEWDGSKKAAEGLYTEIMGMVKEAIRKGRREMEAIESEMDKEGYER